MLTDIFLLTGINISIYSIGIGWATCINIVWKKSKKKKKVSVKSDSYVFHFVKFCNIEYEWCYTLDY